MELRAKTIAEIRSMLDDSYFTAASFGISNNTFASPFFVITFVPNKNFSFKLYERSDGQVMSEESPGDLVTQGEERVHKSLSVAISAIRLWTRRIREEYQHAAELRSEIDEFLEKLRARPPSEDDEDASSPFDESEIIELRSSLDALKDLVTAQAEVLQATAQQVQQFEKEIETIKADLRAMPKGVWRTVASNKLLKSVKGFMGTPEGRALIAEGLKKLIGLD